MILNLSLCSGNNGNLEIIKIDKASEHNLNVNFLPIVQLQIAL